MRISTRCSMAAAGLVTCTAVMAAGQSSPNFSMPLDTVNNGVGELDSLNYHLSSSLGSAVFTDAINSVSFQLRSGYRGEISAPPAVLTLLSVVSRKMHGATPFSLTVQPQPLTGNITVEPRGIGSGHTLVFHFDNVVSSVAAVTALDAALNAAGIASLTYTGADNDVIVTLSNVADNKRLTVTLTGINGSHSASAALGFLVGDVNSSHAVTAADIAAVKANMGKPINTYTFLFDLNADGSITQADLASVRARAGTLLP